MTGLVRHLLPTHCLLLSLPLLMEPTVAVAVEAVSDTPFAQEYREPFCVAAPQVGASERRGRGRRRSFDQAALAVVVVSDDGDDLAATDGATNAASITSKASASDVAWVARPEGVFRWDGSDWQPPAGEAIDGPVFDLLVDANGDVLVAAWNGLYVLRDGKLTHTDAIDEPVAALARDGERVFAAGPRGAWLRVDGNWQRLDGDWVTEINDLALDDEHLWIATDRGLFIHTAGRTTRLHRADQLLSADVRALALDDDGQLWVGSSGGIDVFRGNERQRSITGAEGLPSTDVRSLDFDADGRLWVGTGIGLARYDDGHWVFRHSLRWLPNDSVSDVAFGSDGSAYVATLGGLSVLRTRPMTLADKADYYETVLRSRHVRPPGMIEQCRLATPGDLSTFEPMDTDNDGSFTGYYCAAEAYRYAATGDPRAKQNAMAAFRAMEFLQTVTGTPSFIARTVVPSDWTDVADRNREFTPQELAFMAVRDPRSKYVAVRWRKSADGNWLWKGDTSSDETSGHYFVWGVYYDLIDDEAEQQRVRRLVRRVTDGLIEGGYVLRDIDGEATRWGVWSPERLNGDPNWIPEKGINSVEMLSYLNVAHHVTGDEKYRRAAIELYDTHRYGENVLVPRPSSPADYTFIDDDLLSFSYPGLLGYESDPRRRQRYRESIDYWHGTIPNVHSPFYDFVFASLTGSDIAAAPCVEFLRDVPLDLVRWTVDNTQREDVRLVRYPVIEDIQTDRLLPPSERAFAKWDSNPFQASGGNGGSTEHSPAFWLLPYWMGRYHGYIGPPQE
ncbi:MAG: hypothetical protein KDA63_00675 [Planctomycetales bacterium]|nr:hypothetical protein [Planctomycetales bacterium]